MFLKRTLWAVDMLTLERLKQVLHYNPETGIFTGLIARGKRTDCVGKVIGKYPNSHGYVLIVIDYIKYSAHHLAWFYMTGEWPKWGDAEVDHRNRNRADNKWENLRKFAHQKNSFNHPIEKNNTSGILGVSFDAQIKRWRPSISPNGRMKHLGRFDTIEEALSARIAADKTIFGEYAGRAD